MQHSPHALLPQEFAAVLGNRSGLGQDGKQIAPNADQMLQQEQLIGGMGAFGVVHALEQFQNHMPLLAFRRDDKGLWMAGSQRGRIFFTVGDLKQIGQELREQNHIVANGV